MRHRAAEVLDLAFGYEVESVMTEDLVEAIAAFPREASAALRRALMSARSSTSDDDHEFVVIGGGSGGSVVAGRLAEAGHDVLVLEAGGTDRRPDVLIPAGVMGVYRYCNWKYVPEPDPSRHGVQEAWAAGRILGGGGSINATVFVRGNAADFDGWADRGCQGWDFASVLPHFRRMETWEDGADDFRGGSGPIAVERHSMHHPANDAFTVAAHECGHAKLTDYNGAEQVGVGHVQVNQRRGVRCQASRAYLRPRPARRHRDDPDQGVRPPDPLRR